MSDPAALPYRSNVGIALFNAEGQVLIARRLGDDGPETILPGFEWQMPQGGIDPDEDQEAAARRELWEETGVTDVQVLGRTDAWLRYDFPPYAGPPHKLSAFRGQQQIWFAMRFLGQEGDIDVTGAITVRSRSSAPGDGRTSRQPSTWWCRSGGRSIAQSPTRSSDSRAPWPDGRSL